MCGIAGSVNYKLSYTALQSSMLHRGPDEQNGLTADNIDFYHFRLSIVDAVGGKQPMSLHQRFTIVFNGEIYNHRELRKQFSLDCKTNSDTETLLFLFEKMGADCLQYLDGMFAFAIYDHHQKELFIARDRAGKKPLYYFNDGEKIVFASELNGLKSQLPLEIEHQNFYHYLRLGYFYKEMTPYKNVRELTAGTWIKINCETLDITEKKWWNIHDFYLQNNNDNLKESLQKTNDFLHQAVQRRIDSSDLEVGCFLSGGIDSGLITAIASKYASSLKTFTVSFDSEYDESPLARLVANKYNTNHNEIKISFDNLKNDVENILSSFGEPNCDSSIIPSYYVSEAAKKHVTVILNGDGADELFGGYRRYVPFSKFDFFQKNNFVSNTAQFFKSILPVANEKKSYYNFLNRFISLAAKKGVETYLSAGSDIMEDYESNILSGGYDYLAPQRIDFDIINHSSLSGLKKIMNVDFDTNLVGDLLMKMDIATMKHSLEGRSPFMCKELLEYAPTINDTFKINGSNTKYLLRQLSKQYLPEELINQPKRGFEIPLKNWVNNELHDMIYDYVGSSTAYNKTLVNPLFTQSLLNKKSTVPAEKRAKILWMLFCVEVWHKKVYQG